MLVIAFSVFLIVFVCLGYGGALYKVLRRIGFEGTATLPILLVFGVIALAFLTSVGCLFFPIAAVTQGILFAAGSILLYVSRRVVSD
ncbi:MAG: hypothetical protein HY042_04240, partial [Spirochaetia bacterium]|nr:hypothetical protein [Spirochaetia bacterium]